MIQYQGARYVPKFDGAWDSSKEYEALTVVNYGSNSFTSTKPVPAGVNIGNTEYWLNSGNYNGQVAELQESVGELEKTVQNGRYSFFISPKLFGAKADGITDDTAAIQAAFNYVNNSWINENSPNMANPQAPTGKFIVFDDGIYKFSNVNIVGYDCQIIGNGILLGTLTFGQNEIKWYDFTINGVSFKGSNSGIILRNARRGDINNCKFFECNNAIYLPTQNSDYTQATYRITISGNRAVNCVNFISGISGTNTLGDFIINNNYISLSGYCLQLPYLDGVIMTGNVVFGGNGVQILNGVEMSFNDNHLFETNGTAIELAKMQNVTINNNIFAYNGINESSPVIVMRDYDTSGVNKYCSFTINSNVFLQPSYSAISLSNVGSGNIEGNTFVSCGINPRGSGNSSVNAILISDCTPDIVLTNNIHASSDRGIIGAIVVDSSAYSGQTYTIPEYVAELRITGGSPMTIKPPVNCRTESHTFLLTVYSSIYITDDKGQKSLQKGSYIVNVADGYAIIQN